MTARKTIPALEQIERAKREGDQFPLLKELTRLAQELGPERVQDTEAYETATEVATVESILLDLEDGHPLQIYHQDVMAEGLKQLPVRATPEVAGRRPGFLTWQVQGREEPLRKARQCVLTLVKIGKAAHGIVPPRRTGTLLFKRLVVRAIELVEQKFPELRGLVKPSPSGRKDAQDPEDLRNSDWTPTKAVLDYVAEHFPNAEQEMRQPPKRWRRLGV